MSDYTPTLGEAEGRYSAGRLLLDGERDAGTATERYDEFYRMIAAIEREAAARALSEAADKFAAEDDPEWGWWQDYEGWSQDPSEPLRARAAEYRKGKNE